MEQIVIVVAVLLLALFGVGSFCGSVVGCVVAAIPIASSVLALIGRLA